MLELLVDYFAILQEWSSNRKGHDLSRQREPSDERGSDPTPLAPMGRDFRFGLQARRQSTSGRAARKKNHLHLPSDVTQPAHRNARRS